MFRLDILFVLNELECFNARSGKTVSTASCSSSKNSKASAGRVSRKSFRCVRLKFSRASLPVASRSLKSPNTSVPRPVLSISATSLGVQNDYDLAGFPRCSHFVTQWQAGLTAFPVRGASVRTLSRSATFQHNARHEISVRSTQRAPRLAGRSPTTESAHRRTAPKHGDTT